MKPHQATCHLHGSIAWMIGLGLVILLSGCASRGTVDMCPDVRMENPSIPRGGNAYVP